MPFLGMPIAPFQKSKLPRFSFTHNVFRVDGNLILSVATLSTGNLPHFLYYEARNDYTNILETLLLCNCVRAIGKLIRRQLTCVIGAFTENTLIGT